MLGLISMREDMEHIRGLLDEIEATFEDASRVPLQRGRAVVDRSELLGLLDDLRGSLPAEFSRAEDVRRECRSVLADGEEEAGRVIKNARAEAEARVSESEVLRRSHRRADEMIGRAEGYAEEIATGSEAYRDQVMVQLENWFQDSLDSVAESREELTAGAHRPGHQEAAETQPAEEEGGGRWRANSA